MEQIVPATGERGKGSGQRGARVGRERGKGQQGTEGRFTWTEGGVGTVGFS